MEFEKLRGKKYDHTLKWMAEEEPQGFFEWLMEMLGREGFVLKDSNLSKELAPAVRQVDLVWTTKNCFAIHTASSGFGKCRKNVF